MKRITRPLACVLSSLFVVTLVAVGPRAAGQPLADHVPQDALVYVGWAGAEHLGPGFDQSNLKAFLDASNIRELINESLPRLFEKANGRLLPFGWAKMLLQKPKIDRVRVGFLGVKPEYQHTGVAAKFYVEHFETASWKPQDGGEMGWILESNDAMNRGMEAMGGRVVKKYRLYERLFQA